MNALSSFPYQILALLEILVSTTYTDDNKESFITCVKHQTNYHKIINTHTRINIFERKKFEICIITENI